VSPSSLKPIPLAIYRLASLTPRQREVLHWVAQAKSNWQIGQILGCAEGTVKKHLQRIYRKLGVENRTAAGNVYLCAQHLLESG
jgi:DNA-binding CsgD family transcriptional regulator